MKSMAPQNVVHTLWHDARHQGICIAGLVISLGINVAVAKGDWRNHVLPTMSVVLVICSLVKRRRTKHHKGNCAVDTIADTRNDSAPSQGASTCSFSTRATLKCGPPPTLLTFLMYAKHKCGQCTYWLLFLRLVLRNVSSAIRVFVGR